MCDLLGNLLGIVSIILDLLGMIASNIFGLLGIRKNIYVYRDLIIVYLRIRELRTNGI